MSTYIKKLCCIFLFLSGFSGSLFGVWSSVENVSNIGEGSNAAQVAVDPAGNAIAVWTGIDGGNRVTKSATKPFGGSWSSPVIISSLIGQASNPQIAIDPAGNAVAVWSLLDGGMNALESATKPFGGSWSAPVQVSATQDLFPKLAVDASGNAVTVWVSGLANTVIKAATLPFGGSWSAPTTLSGINATQPDVAVDPSGNATAVWSRFIPGNNIIQASLLPFGGSWSAPVNLSAGGQDAFSPQVTVDASGNSVTVWQRSDGLNTIIQAVTKPFGGSFSSPVDLSAPGGDANLPQDAIASASSLTVAVWFRNDGFTQTIQAATLPFGGSWSTPVDFAPGSDPQVAIDASGNAIAVWTGFDGLNSIIQAANFLNGTWSSIVNISPTGEDSVSPFIAMSPSGYGVAVWVNITVDVIQSATWTPPAPSSINPPRKFRGTVKRNYHLRRDKNFTLKTSWKAPKDTSDVSSYIIYQDGNPKYTLDAATFKFKKHVRSAKHLHRRYKIRAVATSGAQSSKKKLKIHH